MTERTWSRREFIVRSALVAAGGLVAAGSGRPPSREDRPRHLQPLAVARGKDHACLVRRSVERLGGAAAVARPGERVLVKATLGWNRGPGEGANVTPDVLRSVLELALEAGAVEVAVLDRTALRSDHAYVVSGADGVVRKLGDPRVQLVHLRSVDFVPLERNGRMDTADPSLDGYRVVRHLLEADRVVNLAAARQHPTLRAALGLVNLRGLVAGGPLDSRWLDREEIELAIIASAVRPDLTILDATRPVVRNGPMGRGKIDVEAWDTLLASTDPLAVEAGGARLFGLEPDDLGALAVGEAMRLGSGALDPGRVIEIGGGE